MERALITRDFTVQYVADHGSSRTPALYNVATLWAALEGSILLWVLVLTGYMALVVHKFRKRLDDPLVGWAMLAMLVVSAFFFLLLLFPANPFQAFDPPVGFDGPGPNPLLQNHPLMAFHPPMLYLGYVGFTVPFAFAVAALVTGRVGEGWLMETRRWTLFAWGFLTVGIVLGAWWSYEVLNWGGYWGWDPVENASLLPWLTGTAYLHSVMVQERRGMLRVWNLSLVVRHVQPHHPRHVPHPLGRHRLGARLHRGVDRRLAAGVLRADRGRDARADRLAGRPPAGARQHRLAGVARGRVPGQQRAVRRRSRSWCCSAPCSRCWSRRSTTSSCRSGSPYFDRMAVPIGLTLLFLMAVAPVLPWRKASGELLAQRLFWPAWAGAGAVVVAVLLGARGLAPLVAFGLGGFAGGAAVRQVVLATRRQGWRGLVGRTNGGMVVHLGVVLIGRGHGRVGQLRHRARADDGGGRHRHGRRPRDRVPGRPHRRGAQQDVGAGPGQRRRRRSTSRRSTASRDRAGGGHAVGAPRRSPEDVYLTLLRAPEDDAGETVVIRVVVQPLVMWLWIGGGVMAVGTVLAAFPGRRRNPIDPVSAPRAGTVTAGATMRPARRRLAAAADDAGGVGEDARPWRCHVTDRPWHRRDRATRGNACARDSEAMTAEAEHDCLETRRAAVIASPIGGVRAMSDVVDPRPAPDPAEPATDADDDVARRDGSGGGRVGLIVSVVVAVLAGRLRRGAGHPRARHRAPGRAAR